jgi:hypothetical protein
MWQQYKSTFAGMQIVIAGVTLVVLVWSRHLYPAAAFFGVMQLGSLMGAMWATRLKRLMAAAPPDRPRKRA